MIKGAKCLLGWRLANRLGELVERHGSSKNERTLASARFESGYVKHGVCSSSCPVRMDVTDPSKFVG